MADQTAVDKAMFALDGTENKCKYICVEFCQF